MARHLGTGENDDVGVVPADGRGAFGQRERFFLLAIAEDRQTPVAPNRIRSRANAPARIVPETMGRRKGLIHRTFPIGADRVA